MKPQKSNSLVQDVDTSWMNKGVMVWIEQKSDPNIDIFQQAVLDSVENQIATCMSEGSRKLQVPIHLIHERASDYKEKDQYVFFTYVSKGYADMVNMEIINDAELLVNLTIRYQANLIFTYVGPTLLIINPFQGIPGMFEQEVKLQYIGEIIFKRSGHYKDLPPHIYAVAAEAYRSLFENERNQSIVISGESGAGKTENAKYCMNLLTSIGQYQLFQHDPGAIKTLAAGKLTKSSTDIKILVHQAQNQQTGIEDKILSCNPILEAFGNAKTVRNNNSSRFGKYVNMKVSRDQKKIRGAEIINYLLEKSRLVSQGSNERNFHIFYHFLKGMQGEELEKYELAHKGQKISFDSLRYLKSATNTYDVKGLNDENLFAEVVASLNVLGFAQEFESIFKVVAAVLHIGNIVFIENAEGSDHACEVNPRETLISVGKLLGLTEQDVRMCLTYRQREVQKQIINSPLSQADCQGMRDAWAKELYERLFTWLVEKLNRTIVPEAGVQYFCVGLLDIYGFEVFDVNGFEQLMINYTNEKLHQLYIIYVFKEEENVFAQEGLREFCSQIKFTDNQAVMDLLDKHPIGFFDLLDESCQIKGDDDSLLQKVRKTHKDNPLCLQPKMPSKPTFIIVHTAKDVEYTINGFRDKNKDEVPPLMMKITQGSTNSLVSALFTGDKLKKDKSLSKKVRSQMVELMKELNSCDVHFARCIKPNDEKLPLKITQDYALKQVRYLGVLDSLRVRKQNYPVRRVYQFFYKRYGDMTKNKLYPHLLKENANFRDLTIEMFKEYFPTLGPDQVLFGTKRIFIRLTAIPIIDKSFNFHISQKILHVSKIQRAWQRKKLLANLHKFYDRIQRIKQRVKEFRMRIYYKKSLASCIRIQRWIRRYVMERKRKMYQKQVSLLQMLIKRQVQVKKQNTLMAGLAKIQRFVRLTFKMKKLRIKWFCKWQLMRAVQQAWNAIINRRAVKIQSVWKGYIFRKNHRKEVKQIQEAGRKFRIRKVAVKIQKNVRGYLVRSRLEKMHRAAYFIQGHFKMRWLSDLFQRMRAKIVVIQHQVRTFLAIRRALKLKYEQYVLPLEKAYEEQKLREEHHLFGVDEYESPTKLQESPTANLSPFAIGITSPTRAKMNNYFQRKVEDKTISFDEILARDLDPNSVVNPRISLFAFVIDLEIFNDTSEYFPPTWASSYKSLFELSHCNGNPLQTLHAGSTHCYATTANGKVYAWGSNDFNQCGISKKGTIKTTSVPMPGRIIQIDSGADHTLFLTHEGRLYASGNNQQGQLLGKRMCYETKEIELPTPVKGMSSTYNTTIVTCEDGRAYTWPVRDDQGELLVQPYALILPPGNQVVQVSCGNRFAVLVTQHGNLFSFGENKEGELGIGLKDSQIHPTLIPLKNIKFSSISCGFKHSVAKTSLGRVYSWGWGAYGQIGNGKFNNVFEPHLVDVGEQVVQAIASYRSSLLLIDSKTLLWCGSNTTISYQSTLTPFRIQAKAPYLNLPNFSIVRIMSSYSRSYSIIYLTYANHKNMFKNNPAKERGTLHTLTHHWIEKGIKTIDPPTIDSISSFVSEKHMKKAPGVAQAYSTQPGQSRMPTSAKPTQRDDPNKIQSSSSNHSRLSQSRSENRGLGSPSSMTYQVNYRTEDSGRDSQQDLMFNEQKDLYIRIKNEEEEKMNQPQPKGKSNYFQKRQKPRSPVPKQRTLQKTQSSQPASSTQSDSDTEAKIKRLREIKQRLIHLKQIPQTEWSESDHDFLRNIYNSNLSTLLDQLTQ